MIFSAGSEPAMLMFFRLVDFVHPVIVRPRWLFVLFAMSRIAFPRLPKPVSIAFFLSFLCKESWEFKKCAGNFIVILLFQFHKGTIKTKNEGQRGAR